MSLDVCLVSMPYASAGRPSIGLSLMQSTLRAAGISARTLYANLAFAEQVGLSVHQLMCDLGPDKLLGEWTFAAAAFPELARSPGDIAGLVAAVDTGGRISATLGGPTLLELVHELRRYAPIFVDQMARIVLATSPRVVGATSSFQQHCASLALLRRIRELQPGVVTLVGGANCEGDMGQVVARNFPWVDVVVSGEGDEIVVPLVHELLARGRRFDAAALPRGAISARHDATGPAPRAMVHDLDRVAVPDYDDYFLALAASPLSRWIQPALLMETSRGCWWGNVKHCTFCGLNGTGMGFRAKSARRTLEELDALAGRYGALRFEMVDNILDMAYLDTVLPELKRRGAPYSMFYETKANLKREHVELLAAAGIRSIQPGIESLHDEALLEVDKGCSVIHNLQLMKWSRETGVHLTWTMLTGMPQESDGWWAETAGWLHLIEHLQPPSGVSPIHFQRFSPYHSRAEDFGLELAPSRVYRHLFPLPDDELANLAYYFEDRGDAVPAPAGGRRALESAVARWQARWAPDSRLGPISGTLDSAPRLEMIEAAEGLRILDSRACAVASRHLLGGFAADLYRACDRARSTSSLTRSLRAAGHETTAAEVEQAAVGLVDKRLMLRRGGRWLALAVSVAAQAAQPVQPVAPNRGWPAVSGVDRWATATEATSATGQP